MDFDYFYERDGDRFNFLKVPLIFFEEEIFKNLSSDAKLVYSLLLARVSMSYKNGWIEKDTKRVYIIFTIDELQSKLNISNKTAVKILNELDKEKGIGLIEKRRIGLGKPNVIFVKDFMSIHFKKCKNNTSEVKNLHIRNEKNTLQEYQNLHSNYIDNNYIDYNNIDFSRKGIQLKKLGKFSNVFLGDKELEELKKILGSNLDNYIERLSSYMQSTGKKYKDHKATIISWHLRENQKTNTNLVSKDYSKGEHL